MKLISCHIEAFGVLRGTDCIFSDGLNVLLKNNGEGKTTLASFIKAMFYGLPKTRAQSLEENERKKYTPWDGGNFGGNLTFEISGRRYRIERFFSSKPGDERFALYDADTGRPSSDYSEDIGESIFGIDAEGFERTCLLSEKPHPASCTNSGITAKMSGTNDVSEELGSYENALKLIDKERAVYEKRGKKGLVYELEENISDLRIRIEDERKLIAEENAIESEIAEKAIAVSASCERRKELSEQMQKLFEKKKRAEIVKYHRAQLSDIALEESRFSECDSFFRRGSCDKAELDSAEGKYRKIKILDDVIKNSASHERTEKLAAVYGVPEAGADMEELAGIKEAIYRSEIEDAGEGVSDEDIKRMHELETSLPGDIRKYPDDSFGRTFKKYRASAVIFFILTFISAAAALLSPMTGLRLAFAAAALILCACGAFFTISAIRMKKTFADYLKRLGFPVNSSDDLGALLEIMKKSQDEYIDIRGRIERSESKKLRLAKEIDDSILAALNIINKYLPEEETAGVYDPYSDAPAPDRARVKSLADRIISEYTEYRLLSDAYRSTEEDISVKKGEISRLGKEVSEYLSHYPVGDAEDPFGAIREKIQQREILINLIIRKKETAKKFAEDNCISEDEPASVSPEEENALRAETDAEERIYARLLQEKTALEKKRDAIALSTASYDSDCSEEERLSAEYEKAKERLTVLKETYKYLCAAKDGMSSRYLKPLKSSFEKYMLMIGGDKDGKYTLDTSLTVRREDAGELRTSENYSRGTKDLFDIALRFALIDALYTKEMPFVILDDPFITFDAERCRSGLQALSKISSRIQILYLTCHESRANFG